MVKFGLTNVRMVVSILLISIIACLTSFSVLLRHINTTSAALKEEMTTLHKSFEDGLPAVSILSSSSTSSSLQLQRLQQEISPIDNVKEPKCISTSSNTNSVTYRFQPSTKYKQSTTLPQWMKGKANPNHLSLNMNRIENKINVCVAFYFSYYVISLSLFL